MVDGKKIIAYRGIQFLLFSDGKYNYLAFIPAYFYENKKDVSKEEHLEFSKNSLEIFVIGRQIRIIMDI
jgi:hypothetical protein